MGSTSSSNESSYKMEDEYASTPELSASAMRGAILAEELRIDVLFQSVFKT